MAYKFFTQKLLDSDDLDLTQVSPEKQEIAREQNNVTYNLLDIAIFLRDRTENFKFSDAQYVDLDNAIAEIVNRYYKSKNEENPFTKEEVDLEGLEEFESEVPKEAFVAKAGEVKAKGVSKGAPGKKKKEEPKEEAKKPETEKVSKVDNLKKSLEKYQNLIDDAVLDEEDIKSLLETLRKNKEGYEVFDDEPEFVEMAKLNEEFINKNSK